MLTYGQIIKIAEHSGLSRDEFDQSIGRGNGYISGILHLVRKDPKKAGLTVQKPTAALIYEAYPEVAGKFLKESELALINKILETRSEEKRVKRKAKTKGVSRRLRSIKRDFHQNVKERLFGTLYLHEGDFEYPELTDDVFNAIVDAVLREARLNGN